MRTCHQCGEIKPDRKFRKTTAGKRQDCKPCEWLLAKSKLDKTKESLRRKSGNERLKSQVLGFYGEFCACCGETYRAVLSIDHINEDGAAHRREIGRNLYRWLVNNGFPSGFQTLCRNCNWAKAYGGCWHKESREWTRRFIPESLRLA